MIKRIFDIMFASFGVILTCPLLCIAAVLVKLDSPGPILFKQERIGRNLRPFWIYKFRTMTPDARQPGMAITVNGDLRITRVGRVLRKAKIDELPQLFNVLRGDMSLVGPRPEVQKYVELFRQEYEEILKVRPGITDLASLKYRDEAELLAMASDPELEYCTIILPDKISLAQDYIKTMSFYNDIRLIVKTLFRILR